MLRSLYASSLDLIEAHPSLALLSRGNIRAPRGGRGTIPSDAGSVVSIFYCFCLLLSWGCRWDICDCWRIIDLQHYIASEYFGGCFMKRWMWSVFTAMSITSISMSLHVFRIMPSVTRATSPVKILPRYFGVIIMWSVSSDTVCRSWRSSFLRVILILAIALYQPRINLLICE